MDRQRVRVAAGVLALAAAVGCGKAGDDAIDTAGTMKMMDSTRDTATLNPVSTPTDTTRRDSVPPTHP